MNIQDIALRDAFLAGQRAVTAAARAKAKASVTRRAERERGPAPVPLPPRWTTTPRQVATLRAVAAELAVHERASSKIRRGWERLPLRTAPPGSAAVAMLSGKRLIRLAVDVRGTLRLIEAGEVLGAEITLSEACAMARG